MKIGFFDSGIGGLSVLHRAIGALPNEDFIYYSDEDNVPYGEKTRGEIVTLSDRAAGFLIQNGAKIIVIACNTATSAAASYLREKLAVPIVGMEPAVKPAVKNSGGKRVLVTATPLTIREERLKNLIQTVDTDGAVDLLPLPRLVEFAQRLEFESDAVHAYLAEELGRFDALKYGQVVLGCTHFNYFKSVFRELLPNVSLIDGIGGTVRQLVSVLESRGMLENGTGKVEYFISGRKVTDAANLDRFAKLHERIALMEQI